MPNPVLTPAANDLLCGRCGYNLRGVPSDRCPECGRQFDPGRLIGELIPWEQRRYIGRVRAYWRTVRLVTFHPGEAAKFMRNPIGIRHARRFRWVTLGFAAGSLLGVTLVCRDTVTNVVSAWGSYRMYPDAFSLFYASLGDPWSLVITLTGLLSSLMLAMMITTAYFCPRSLPEVQRQRAFAFGHYSGACLALAMPLALLVACLCWVLGPGPPAHAQSPDVTSNLLQIGWLIVPVVMGYGAWCLHALIMLQRVLDYRLSRIVRIAALLLAVHVVGTLAIVAGLHLVVSFVVLFVLSFR